MLTKLLIFILSIYQVLLLEEKTAALILARGGSKGIRLKNLQIVGGITLLGRSILTAKNAGIDDVTVSTDHPIIALEALRYNVSVFKRCSTASTDWAPSLWGVLEFIERRSDVTTLVLLQVTSPFIQAKHLRSALIKLNEPTPFDCVFSVTRSHKLRWDCEKFLPLNFDVSNRPRRQDWNGEFVESGAFYVTRTSLLRQGYLQNSKRNSDELQFMVGGAREEPFDGFSPLMVPGARRLRGATKYLFATKYFVAPLTQMEAK